MVSRSKTYFWRGFPGQRPAAVTFNGAAHRHDYIDSKISQHMHQDDVEFCGLETKHVAREEEKGECGKTNMRSKLTLGITPDGWSVESHVAGGFCN